MIYQKYSHNNIIIYRWYKYYDNYIFYDFDTSLYDISCQLLVGHPSNIGSEEMFRV